MKNVFMSLVLLMSSASFADYEVVCRQSLSAAEEAVDVFVLRGATQNFQQARQVIHVKKTSQKAEPERAEYLVVRVESTVKMDSFFIDLNGGGSLVFKFNLSSQLWDGHFIRPDGPEMPQIFLNCTLASQAAVNFDGCYQLYTPGTMYASFCLDGTQEEGRSGAGVRLVIFGTNSDLISACAVSSALGGSANSLEFILGGKKELILSEVMTVQSRLEGVATFGRTNLKFIQIDEPSSERLLSKFYAEPRCQSLSAGEIAKLRTP